MQSAPPEVSQTVLLTDTTQGTTSSLQHGLPSYSDPEFGDTTAVGVTAESATSPRDEQHDDASDASGATHRGRRFDIRRLSSQDGSSQEGSPGSKIQAYERDNASPRKPSDGMIFQIVPSATGKQDNVSLLDFPNEVLTHILSHLPPESLSLMSLVSRRFHRLVTTPPAWRIAFARFFLGADSTIDNKAKDSEANDRSQRRRFTRVSALASWRSEYILRTRLLRSLGRGRPAIQHSSKSNSSRHSGTAAAAVLTYGSGLMYPVSHIHASFGVGLNKKQPLFVHGAVEQGAVSSSDPAMIKIGNWALGDFENFKHFSDEHAGEAEYGLGSGDIVGMPNVMDISQPYGKLYGEARPGGRLFYTSTSEQRGRFLPIASMSKHDLGIPEVTMIGCAITAVWIAKSEGVLKVTNGIFGSLAGFSNGVLAAYALGVNPVQDRRYEKGEPTAKWAVCPGVPIIAVCIDERVSTYRVGHRRIWATVLNALGEVFYLINTPSRPDFKGRLSPSDVDRIAWQTGRTVEWMLVESTRRVARFDPYNAGFVNGSYSPRTSSDCHGLGTDQLKSEAQEIEKFLRYKPKHFQGICEGWDMRSKLVVDFGGDDRNGGGESIFVIRCGLGEGDTPSIVRFSRQKLRAAANYDPDPYPAISTALKKESIFGGVFAAKESTVSSPSVSSMPRSRTSSTEDLAHALFMTEWRLSNFSFGEVRNVEISAIGTDDSDFAVLTANEDPLLGMSGGSNTSSPLASPLGPRSLATSVSEIPGHRARFMAVGTTSGSIVVWDMRSASSSAPDIINDVQPVRYIYTRSPQISSMAMTSLYLVHGGNDGLVQAWDPLASSTDPIRTLNSRFSDRARRRIAQAEASVQGVGNNYYAASAIVLDPDPTVLRGMVALGTRLRYWYYSAGTADIYKNRKRGQLRRRSERGSNAATNDQKYHHTGRGVLRDYIADEKHELEKEKVVKRKEHERLIGRFGTNLLGEDASEEEMLAYATMLSEESYTSDVAHRKASPDISTVVSGAVSYTTPSSAVESMDADMEEAIRLSLLDSEFAAESPQTTDCDVPIRYSKGSRHNTPLKSSSTGTAKNRLPSFAAEDDDLNFALQLSLAEQESSRAMHINDDFPTLEKSHSSSSEGIGKGKGKSRRI